MPTFNFKNWDVKHTLMAIGAVFLGGVVGYFDQQSAATLLAALTSKGALEVMGVHAVGAGVLALLTMARKSFVAATPPSSGATVASNVLPFVAATPPAAPVSTRLLLAYARLSLLVFAALHFLGYGRTRASRRRSWRVAPLAAAGLLAACSASQQAKILSAVDVACVKILADKPAAVAVKFCGVELPAAQALIDGEKIANDVRDGGVVDNATLSGAVQAAEQTVQAIAGPWAQADAGSE